MSDEFLKYKIGISLIPGVGSINAKKLIAYTGSVEAVFAEKKKNIIKIPGIGEYIANNILNQQVIGQAEKEVEFIEKFNIGYHFYLDEAYPARLKNCEDAPIILFCKGEANFNQSKVLSIVGTRNATDYGKECCNKLIDDFQSRGHKLLIVSGLAYGIDSYAHRAALRNGFETVAVLGHGLSTLYPSANRTIAKEISNQGALVTEFINDTPPDRNNFVRRNRIVAGLADATIVVESGVKGGALITADFASSYNRDVLAFPGRTFDLYSRGCNWLVKTNKASLIENIDDLEYLMGWDSPSKKAMPLQTALFTEISEDEQRIVDVLREMGEFSIDLISLHVNLPVSKVSAMLLNLEFAGIVRSLPGKMYRLTR